MGVEAVEAGRAPLVPSAAERVWSLFWTLDRRRSSNGYGANAISHQEIEACARLYGARLAPWELRALDAMEQARLGFLNRDRDEPEAPKPPAQDMTPGLFMALFGGKKG